MTGRIKGSSQSVSQSVGLVVSGFRNGAFAEVRASPTWHEALVTGGLEDGAEAGLG